MNTVARIAKIEKELKEKNPFKKVPAILLRKGVIRARLTEINGVHYLVEQYANDITVNGRSETKPKPIGYQYISYKGEWYLGKQVQNEIRTVLGYETPIGYLDEQANPPTLDGKPVHIMIRLGTYDFLVQDYEDFEAGKRNNGEYNEAVKIYAAMKK